MAGHMAADIYCHGKPRYMRWICFYIHGKRGGAAAEALRAYIKLVYPCEQLLLHLGIAAYAAALRNGAAERLFGKQCAVFKIAADADADHYGRAGI